MATSPAIDHHATSGYSLPMAYWLAQASDLAYKDEPTIAAQARDWGFDEVRHHRTRFTPPFPLEDTQAYTAASGDMIITAFRGTEPAQIRDWLSDAGTPPWTGPAETGYVHHGFAEALQSVFPGLKDTLAELRTRNQTVWFTGHSLGGALAMLAAARIYLEDPRLQADGVYTYGQPRTCDRILANAYNKGLNDRAFRFVNNNDIVPQLPPEPAFTHAESLRYIDSAGKLHASMGLLGGLADRAKGMTADAFAPATDGTRDHSIKRYIAALEKNLP